VEGTTGIDVGESSASLDTIIGDHVLTVDVDNQLVRLDDGTFVSFDSDSADLALQNSAGEVVYVDMSGLTTASETVTVNLSSVVKMSIDDGASWTEAPDLIDNVAVEDSATGRVLFVNATGVERLGIEPIHVEGTYDIFGAMINIRDLLLNTRSLTAAQQVSLLDQAIGSVEEAAAGLTEKMTGLGSRIKAMDGMKTMLDNMTSNAKAQKAGLQNADVAQMAIDITRIQTLYQLTLSAAAKTLNISILDYL
jgi:flagellin-like hook-associated protein FlgL